MIDLKPSGFYFTMETDEHQYFVSTFCKISRDELTSIVLE